MFVKKMKVSALDDIYLSLDIYSDKLFVQKIGKT